MKHDSHFWAYFFHQSELTRGLMVKHHCTAAEAQLIALTLSITEGFNHE